MNIASIFISLSAIHIHCVWLSYIYSQLLITSLVNLESVQWPAPSWLVSSVGRALHRYRRNRGLKSPNDMNFFQASFSLLPIKWCSLLQRSLPYSTSILPLIVVLFFVSFLLNSFCFVLLFSIIIQISCDSNTCHHPFVVFSFSAPSCLLQWQAQPNSFSIQIPFPVEK